MDSTGTQNNVGVQGGQEELREVTSQLRLKWRSYLSRDPLPLESLPMQDDKSCDHLSQ